MWRESSLLCYDPPLLSKFSCCLLTVMSSVDDLWVPTATFGLPEGAHCSFISELEQGSRYFTYQKVQDQKAAQQVSQLTWWSQTVKVLKSCQTNSHSTLLFPSSHRTASIFLALFYLFPPLCAGNCCPFRITLADLEDSLDYYMPYTSRKERKLIFKCLE